MKPNLLSYYRKLRQPVWTTELGFRHRWSRVTTARYAFWGWKSWHSELIRQPVLVEPYADPFYADPLREANICLAGKPLTLGDLVVVVCITLVLFVLDLIVYSR